jgi:hypothetical protein
MDLIGGKSTTDNGDGTPDGGGIAGGYELLELGGRKPLECVSAVVIAPLIGMVGSPGGNAGLMKVAHDFPAKGGRAADEAVGFDVAAESD